MSVDDFLDELSEEARAEMRVLLRKAYESGFREALAGAGQPQADSAPSPAEPPPAHASAPAAAPVAWTSPSPGTGNRAPELEAEEGEDEEEDTAEALPVRPILPLATIGTLRRRIIRTFDLERFDVDVVICRSGDPDRRQLRSTARLGLYRREEG